jgi:hypothetical protein
MPEGLFMTAEEKKNSKKINYFMLFVLQLLLFKPIYIFLIY